MDSRIEQTTLHDQPLTPQFDPNFTTTQSNSLPFLPPALWQPVWVGMRASKWGAAVLAVLLLSSPLLLGATAAAQQQDEQAQGATSSSSSSSISSIYSRTASILSFLEWVFLSMCSVLLWLLECVRPSVRPSVRLRRALVVRTQ